MSVGKVRTAVKFEVLCYESGAAVSKTTTQTAQLADAALSRKTRAQKDLVRRHIHALSHAISPDDLGRIKLHLMSAIGEDDAFEEEILASNSVFNVLTLYIRRKNLAPWWNWRKLQKLKDKILPPNLRFMPTDCKTISDLDISQIQKELEEYFRERIRHKVVNNRNVLAVLIDSAWKESEDYQNLSSFLTANNNDQIPEIVQFLPVLSTDSANIDFQKIISQYALESPCRLQLQDIESKLTVHNHNSEFDSDAEDKFPFADKCSQCHDNPCKFVLPCQPRPVHEEIKNYGASNSVDVQPTGTQPIVKPFQV